MNNLAHYMEKKYNKLKPLDKTKYPELEDITRNAYNIYAKRKSRTYKLYNALKEILPDYETTKDIIYDSQEFWNLYANIKSRHSKTDKDILVKDGVKCILPKK